MYCNNCGDKGHVFKSCPDPIISCGILFLRGIYEPLEVPVDSKSISVLMVRRKDSMSYMEFIRGKYDSHDTEYIKKQLENMTIQEQKFVLTSKFETLWSKLWGNSRDIDSPEYDTACNKFSSLNLKKLILLLNGLSALYHYKVQLLIQYDVDILRNLLADHLLLTFSEFLLLFLCLLDLYILNQFLASIQVDQFLFPKSFVLQFIILHCKDRSFGIHFQKNLLLFLQQYDLWSFLLRNLTSLGLSTFLSFALIQLEI
jgi:hypothetical protein